MSLILSILLRRGSGLAGFFHKIENKAVAISGRNTRVTKQNDDIDRQDRVMHRGHHSAIQKIAGFVNARRVDEDDLSVFACDDSLDFVTSGLRLVRNGGDLLANEVVKKRRFARVRTPDERDVAAAEILLSPAFRQSR